MQAALNVSTSVEELGLYGPSQERAWVRTGTESLHLWEWWRACSEDVEGGDVPFAEWGDARGAAAAAAAGTPLEQALQEVGRACLCVYVCVWGRSFGRSTLYKSNRITTVQGSLRLPAAQDAGNAVEHRALGTQ